VERRQSRSSARTARIQPRDSPGCGHAAAVCRTRRRSCVGKAARRQRRKRERSRCLGISATVLAAHSGFAPLVDFLLEAGADANSAEAGFSALHEAILRRDEHMVASCSRTAPIESAAAHMDADATLVEGWNFYPELVGATPFWLAARFNEVEVMRQLAARGADTRFVIASNTRPTAAR
jgi:ankyrin repeat protein